MTIPYESTGNWFPIRCCPSKSGKPSGRWRERKLLKHAAKHAHPLPVTAESYYGQSLLAELHRFLQIPQARFRDMAADVFYSRAPHDDKAQVLSRLASDADGLVARPARDYLRSLSLQQEADANLSAEDLPAEPS